MKKTEDALENGENGRKEDGRADNKGRILFLLELLRRETDEEHPLYPGDLGEGKDGGLFCKPQDSPG